MSNRQTHSFSQSHSGATTGTEENSVVIAPTEDETDEGPLYPHLHHPSQSHSPSPSILDSVSPPPPPQTTSLLSSSSSLTIETVDEEVSMPLDGSTTTEQPPTSPRLPSGQEIDAKNTCQSHSVIVVTEFNTTPANASARESEQSRPLPAPHSILRTTTMGIGTYQSSTTDDIMPNKMNNNLQTNKNFGPNTGSESTILSIRSPSSNDNDIQYLQSSPLSTHPPAVTSSRAIPTNGYKSGLMTRTTRNNIPTVIHGSVPNIPPQTEANTAAAFVTTDTDTISSEIRNTFHSVTIASQPPPFATARLIVPALSNPRLRPIQLEQPVVQIDTATDIIPTYERFSARKPLCVWIVMFTLLVSFSAVLVPTVYCTVRQSCTGRRRPRPRPPTASPIANITMTTTPPNPNGTSTTANNDHVRRVAVANFINNITHTGLIIAHPNGTSSETTPGSKPFLSAEEWAANWLVDSDPLQLIPNTTMFRIRISQRYALLTLWFQQNSQFEWKKTDNWASEEHECHWYGIHCEKTTIDGISRYVVTKVHLPYNNIIGTMSPDLGLLSTLRYWNMSVNGLQGEIPKSILVSWKHIEYFDMNEYNPYSSPGDAVSLYNGIQDAALHWNKIRYFAFRGHYISELPSSLYRWSNIQHFDASAIILVGSFPDFMRAWSRLTSLTLAGNPSMEGSLPAWIGEWTNLEAFDITECGFTGTIPPSIGNWTKVRSVLVARNSFIGTLPSLIGQWTNLQDLDMASYDDQTSEPLKGTLPSGIANWSELRTFSIANNVFSGSLPESLYQWKHVTIVDFSNNRFTGSLPLSIDQWSAIEHVDFSGNRLSGTLPESLSQWRKLRFLQLRNNTLRGTIPMSIGRCTLVEHFDISYNLLTGTIPGSIGNWSKIMTVAMSSNSLQGTLPDSMMHWSTIQLFDVATNQLSGTIPYWVGNWSALQIISIGQNSFHGIFPDTVGNWSSINEVYFGQNELTGTLPYSMRRWTTINTFDVAVNRLSGSIPDWLGNLDQLYNLYLGNNNFHGTIPATFEALTSLSYFDIGNNSFTGEIPSFVGTWTGLLDANFGNNSLTGTLPSFKGLWTRLTSLRVNDNQFHGRIPTSAANWRSLQYGYFNGNNFSGSVPIDLCVAEPVDDFGSDYRVSNITELVADCIYKVVCECCTRCL